MSGCESAFFVWDVCVVIRNRGLYSWTTGAAGLLVGVHRQINYRPTSIRYAIYSSLREAGRENVPRKSAILNPDGDGYPILAK
jgi:hypothetical protein